MLADVAHSCALAFEAERLFLLCDDERKHPAPFFVFFLRWLRLSGRLSSANGAVFCGFLYATPAAARTRSRPEQENLTFPSFKIPLSLPLSTSLLFFDLPSSLNLMTWCPSDVRVLSTRQGAALPLRWCRMQREKHARSPADRFSPLLFSSLRQRVTAVARLRHKRGVIRIGMWCAQQHHHRLMMQRRREET